MLTQIYEVTSAQEAAAISEMGVDHIGVLVGDGSFPREQSRDIGCGDRRVDPTALEAFRALPVCGSRLRGARDSGARAGNRAPGRCARACHAGACPGAQARGSGDLVMRSVPVVGSESIDIARRYEGIADFLLLDSYRANDKQIGALGVTHDWSISRQIVAAGCACPSFWPAGSARTTSPTRSVPFVPPASTRRRERTRGHAHEGLGEGEAVRASSKAGSGVRAAPAHATVPMPMRPKPGSLMAGRRMSMPATRPSTLISTPSTQPIAEPEETAERELDAGAAGREAEDAGVDPPVLADGGRRQGDAGLGDGGQHVGDERVGVGPGPHRVVAVVLVGIARDGGPDLGDQRLRGRPLDGADQHGAMAIPARVGRPVIGLDRLAPGDLVVAGVGAGAASP